MTLDHLVQRVAAALSGVEAVRVAWVFGSQVERTAGPRSDLDLAVAYRRGLDEVEREKARRQVVAALTDSLGRLGERADVVDVERGSSAVAFKALRGGLRVLSRSEPERVEAEVRVLRRYDDVAPRRALYRK